MSGIRRSGNREWGQARARFEARQVGPGSIIGVGSSIRLFTMLARAASALAQPGGRVVMNEAHRRETEEIPASDGPRR
jgi:hypothetical protein